MTAPHGRTSPLRIVIGVLCVAVDLLILFFSASLVIILVTGGGVVHAFGATVRARSVDNPVWILTGLTLLRYAMRSWPFLGVRRWPIDSILERGIGFVARFPAAAARLFRWPLLGVALVTVLVFVIRILLASKSPGFYSGDDVEIHEMTLGVLLRKPWPVWDLRCAFFPMCFIYPAQRTALALGWTSPEMLVLSGRVAVALISSAAIPLTWWTARRLAPHDERLAVVSVLLLAINKLQMSFGSSELPRPVSTVFVLAAFLLILRGRVLQVGIAGILLGIAVAFRFSEIVFVPAALATLRRERYWIEASALLIGAAATAAVIIGVSDALYWGRPFSSLAAAFHYTVVQRQSSRGYEPPWEYLTIIPAWSTFMFVALALVGTSRRTPESWWLWLPIGVLSFLPHKESRYLLPVIPFLCISAARGFLTMSEWLARTTEIAGWRRWGRALLAPLLILAVLHDLGGWRLSRSDEGVRLAEFLRVAGRPGLAAQDSWRLGGRPYLWTLEPVTDLAPEWLSDPPRLAAALKDVTWIALRSRVARTVGDRVLYDQGFERDPAWHGEDYVLYTRVR